MRATTQPSISCVETGDGPRLVTLDGDLDLLCAAELERCLYEALALTAGGAIIDLRGVASMDSEVRRTLRKALRSAERHGREVAVVKPNPHVWEVLEDAGVC